MSCWLSVVKTPKIQRNGKRRFRKNIAQSEMGKETPVKIVSIEGDKFPRWFKKAMEEGRIGQILGTPTFIIWDDVSKKELGRLEGYTQKEKFYSQLNEAFSQISQGLHPGRREGSGGSHQEEGSGASNKGRGQEE